MELVIDFQTLLSRVDCARNSWQRVKNRSQILQIRLQFKKKEIIRQTQYTSAQATANETVYSKTAKICY